jgi:hypothetical protein
MGMCCLAATMDPAFPMAKYSPDSRAVSEKKG